MPQFNYETEKAGLQRQQALIDALMARSMQPPQGQFVQNSAGTFYAGPGALGALAQTLGGQFVASQQQKALDEKQNDLQTRYQEGMRNALNTYEQTRNGSPMPETPGGGPALPPNPRRAAMEAIISSYPGMQEIGRADLKALGSGKSETFSAPQTVIGPDGRPTLVMPGNQGTLKPVEGFMPYEKPMTVEGRVISPLSPGQPLADYSTKGLELIGRGGDLYQKDSQGFLKKLDNAPKISLSNIGNTFNKGESKFAEIVGGESAKAFIDAKAQKINAQRTIQSMQRLEALDKGGNLIGGPFSDIAMQATTLAEAVGFPIDRERLAKSETYKGEMMSNLKTYLTGSLARSTTDADMKILMAPMPQLLASPAGRAALRRQIAAKAQEEIDFADQTQRNTVEAFPEGRRLLSVTPGEVPVPQRSDIGPTKPSGPAKKPTVSNW